jgi:F-type H+-transporting ATPase subunit b
MAGETTEHADAASPDGMPDAEGAVVHATTEAHGGETHGVFPPFDPATYGSQLLWLAITFGALYLMMSKIALPRIGDILEVRRDRVEGDLAEADRLRQKTDQAIADYEAALADARGKAHGIAEETRTELKRETEKSRAETEAELSARVAAAESSIQATKAEALTNVDEIAAQTAVSVVTALAGKVSIADARNAVKQVVKG